MVRVMIEAPLLVFMIGTRCWGRALDYIVGRAALGTPGSYFFNRSIGV